MFNLENFSENIAVVEENGREITYGDLQKACDLLASQISSRSLIFNLCQNCFGSLVGYVSALCNRNVPLMLDAQIDKTLLFNFLAVYKPDYLWVPKAMSGYFGGRAVFASWEYVLVKTDNDRIYPLAEDLALLLTTSGSTGSPKFVRQSYRNIQANTDSIVKYLNLDDRERAITSLPMNYTFGLSVINSHLAVGASLILSDKTLMQREFWQQLGDYKATSLSGVPYTFEMLDRLRFYRRDLPNLRTMTQAGGKLLPELHKKFAEYAEQTGKKFVVMYGQTEATARMSYLPPEKCLEKVGSMGVAIPGGRFFLINENGEIITEAERVGELVYEGDNVTLGYAVRGEDLAKGDERHGRLETGDMAKFDKDGYFYIVGRKKRFLKIFGNRVNLDETERLIKGCFNEIDCACAGRDDAMYIFITDESKAKEVRNFVAETSHLNFTAFHVKYLASIPRNDVGKAIYAELEKYYD